MSLVADPEVFAAREILSRSNGGIEVRILWNKDAEKMFVAVVDTQKGGSWWREVPPVRMRYAFEHPFPFFAERERA